MASLEVQKSGNKTGFKIRLILDRERKTISLSSEYTRRQADKLRAMVEEMVEALETGRKFDRVLSAYLENLPPELTAKLERVGLIKSDVKSMNILQLWDNYISFNTANGKKYSTIQTYETAKKRFFAFFNPADEPDNITPEKILEWKTFLRGEGYAEATLAGSHNRGNAVFNWGVKRGFCTHNPFTGVKRESYLNPQRMFFVPMEWYEKLLDACPNQTWRTIIALCRIGGLRNPSETLLLTWQDVNWEKNLLLVHSPKTEHHPGKAERVIPLWERLKIELERQFEQAEEGGSPYIIDKFRGTSANMSTYFSKIVFWAGLPKWGRLFQNLRESRANEVFTAYPVHIAEKLMGHDYKTASKHYLKITENQFEQLGMLEPSNLQNRIGIEELNPGANGVAVSGSLPLKIF